MRTTKRAVALILILALSISAMTMIAYAYATYESFSSLSIVAGESADATDYTTLSAATYRAVITKNTGGCDISALLTTSKGIQSSWGTIYGTGNVDLTVQQSGSYKLVLYNDDFQNTTVTGYYRSLS